MKFKIKHYLVSKEKSIQEIDNPFKKIFFSMGL